MIRNSRTADIRVEGHGNFLDPGEDSLVAGETRSRIR